MDPRMDNTFSQKDKLTGTTVPVGFDFTWHMRRLCEHICNDVPEMHHIDMSRVAISFSQARKSVRHGLHASLTPMRFEGGAETGERNGTEYRAQRLYDAAGMEMLYILRFYLPRFQNEPFGEKLTTIFHELWHISPQFDGDLRRHEGRCYIHSQSEAEYDAHAARLAQAWLSNNPDPAVFDFLNYDFQQLELIYHRIIGVKIPQPKLIPLSA